MLLLKWAAEEQLLVHGALTLHKPKAAPLFWGAKQPFGVGKGKGVITPKPNGGRG